MHDGAGIGSFVNPLICLGPVGVVWVLGGLLCLVAGGGAHMVKECSHGYWHGEVVQFG